MLLVVTSLVAVVTFLFFYVSFKKLLDTETSSSYECGFNMISITRMFFSFRFFLISILFLIFDVEIALMLPIPYLVFGGKVNFSIYIFMLVLSVGLLYEYYYGSLSWMNFISKA